MSQFGLEPHRATHALDGLAHDGQPNAGARILFIVMDALEDREEPLLRLLRNANATVLKPEVNLVAISFASNDDPGLLPRADKLDRVVEACAFFTFSALQVAMPSLCSRPSSVYSWFITSRPRREPSSG